MYIYIFIYIIIYIYLVKELHAHTHIMLTHVLPQFQSTSHLTRPSWKRNQLGGSTSVEKINIWKNKLGENSVSLPSKG